MHDMAIRHVHMNGIIVVDKPRGWTSHDCVAKIRKLAGTKKVGHTGTLDPEVSGVLPVCLGQATRVVQFLTDQSKEYEARITFGQSTTTEDQTGDVVEDAPLANAPQPEEIERALSLLRGDIEQVPPMFSAVKIKGKRLYEWAREGVEVPRPARRVTIYELETLAYEPSLPYPVLTIRVHCSKGTYIRTLGVDIGRALGLPAHMSALVRTKSGPFTLEDSVPLSALEEWKEEDWLSRLFPIDAALKHLPSLRLSAELLQRVNYGQTLPLSQAVVPGELYRIYDEQGRFTALYNAVNEHLIKPKKVFLTQPNMRQGRQGCSK
jgi:tRNA pseudouridine55 synthase